MCSPIAVMAVTAIASTAVATYSSYQQTRAQNAAAEYNAEVQNRNSKIAEMQAVDAKKRGEVAEKQHRLQISKLMGEQRAGYGASGVLVDSGSALDTLEDTAFFGEQDALTIRHNAAKEAWGYKNQALNYTSQSALSRASKQSVALNTSSTLLTNASSNYMSFYGAKAAQGTSGGKK